MKKFIKTVSILSAILTLTGCGRLDRATASLTGFSQACIENVQYIQFSSGASVKYKPDGSIATCGKVNSSSKTSKTFDNLEEFRTTKGNKNI